MCVCVCVCLCVGHRSQRIVFVPPTPMSVAGQNPDTMATRRAHQRGQEGPLPAHCQPAAFRDDVTELGPQRAPGRPHRGRWALSYERFRQCTQHTDRGKVMGKRFTLNAVVH